MELESYHFKRKLRNTHSGYGIAATSIEKCPIHEDIMIGSVACISKSCCKGHAPFMRIVMNKFSWVKCEETTRMVNAEPLLA